MNKLELVRQVSKHSKLTQKECLSCLNALTTVVQNTLKKGDNISLVGFGKFDVKYKNARKSYNPHTKENILLPATKIPYFKAGKTFKQAIF